MFHFTREMMGRNKYVEEIRRGQGVVRLKVTPPPSSGLVIFPYRHHFFPLLSIVLFSLLSFRKPFGVPYNYIKEKVSKTTQKFMHWL